MDTNAREQIRLILEHLTEKGKNSFNERIDGMFADHSASGQLRSGNTILASLKIMEESGEALLNKSLDDVAAITKDVEAFAMLQTNLESHVRFMELKLEDVLRVSGAAKEGLVMSAASREAKLKFEGIRSSLKRQIEMHRFTFTQPFASPNRSQADRAQLSEIPTNSRNPGGKPLAKHWDELWSAIAVKLYFGDLKPNTQADIERAMKDWFAENDLDVGDTTIRGRARVLWMKIRADK